MEGAMMSIGDDILCSGDLGPELPEDETIKRRCLRCDKDFLAKGRFNRMCRSCKIDWTQYTARRSPLGGSEDVE